MITEDTAQRLANALEHLATAIESHCTPRPTRRNRRVHERRELDSWLDSDAWPEGRDGGGC